MSDSPNESAIVRAVADAAAQRITRRVVAALQDMQDLMSGEDSGLANTWDEICVQVQYEESHSWQAYDQTVKALVSGCVAELPKHERDALWLQTDEGNDWDDTKPEQRAVAPIYPSDIVKYVTSEYVYKAAGRWSNDRIRAFIDRSSLSD